MLLTSDITIHKILNAIDDICVRTCHKVLFYMANKFLQFYLRARCSSVVRAFAHGAMGRWIDPSCGEPIELFLVPASAPRLV